MGHRKNTLWTTMEILATCKQTKCLFGRVCDEPFGEKCEPMIIIMCCCLHLFICFLIRFRCMQISFLSMQFFDCFIYITNVKNIVFLCFVQMWLRPPLRGRVVTDVWIFYNKCSCFKFWFSLTVYSSLWYMCH